MSTRYRVEVRARAGQVEPRGAGLAAQIQGLGVEAVAAVEVRDLYFLELADGGDAGAVTRELLCDPVIEEASVGALDAVSAEPGRWTVEVAYQPGVTDTEAESLLEGARLAGFSGLVSAATGRRYLLSGEGLNEDLVRRITRGLLANEVVEVWAINEAVKAPLLSGGPTAPDRTVERIPLANLDDAELDAVSAERRLSLDTAEMRAIQAHYRKLQRDPTDVELETLAQTWSEHCVHKTFRAHIDYTGYGPDGDEPTERFEVDGLLNQYIRAATETINAPWVHSAFVDNAGIIAFDEGGPDDRVGPDGRPLLDLAFKVETHNHPSALEPFGGANTGVGGVIRDILGVSARPIANTDVLCFGPPDLPFDELPEGVLHPRRIADGVIDGVEDYGNKMGIPTVNGAVLYDPGYTANPLVYVGCLGVLPRGSHPVGARPGDQIVVFGGRTGRDGLRGATFSSMEMDHETTEVSGSAVQIGHPIHEKQAMEALLVARDERLYSAITDCGAGGLSSAIGEMAEHTGARVELDRVPLKYPGLKPWEIWLSEAQERMVIAVPPEHIDRVMALCRSVDVEATVLGEFTDDQVLTLTSGGETVAEFDMAFLHSGIPRRRLVAEWRPSPRGDEPKPAMEGDLTADLLTVLRAPDVRSKADVVRRYDHEVQGGTVVKPLVGAEGHGDGAVVVPLESWGPGVPASDGPVRGAALGLGVCPRYGRLDPEAMAWAVVDEAARNVVAMGADPRRVAILDNFCWGNPKLPDRLGALVKCARGCHDAAVAYGMPFVSGKDSLNNEYTDAQGQKRAIPGTLLVSAVGLVPDITRTTTSALKAAGQVVFVVGDTAAELGGSIWLDTHGARGTTPPQRLEDPLARLDLVHAAIAAGEISACHDCSEGGLAVALAEMALAGRLGLRVNLRAAPTRGAPLLAGELLFSESLGRFVLTTPEASTEAFRARCEASGVPFAEIGVVTDDDRVRLRGGDGHIDTDLATLDDAFAGHLRSTHS